MMKETAKATPADWRPEDSRPEEDEITHPIRIVSSKPGVSKNAGAQLLKPGESAPRTPDWTEIGDPAA